MPRTPAEAFGIAIRQLRLERGLSQETAAHESRIDLAYYRHLERANKCPTLTTVWKIADALGETPSELIRRAEKHIDDD